MYYVSRNKKAKATATRNIHVCTDERLTQMTGHVRCERNTAGPAWNEIFFI